LRRENKKLEDDYKALDDAYDEMEASMKHFKSRYEYVTRLVIRPYARSQKLPFDDSDGLAIDLTIRPLVADALEGKDLREQLQASQDAAQALQDRILASEGQTKSLQNQVQLLQKQMLSQVDKVLVISDDQLSQDFRALAALVKSLSRSIRVTEDMDVCGVLTSHQLHTDVAEYHWASRSRKKYYIEAWVWSILYQEVFSSPFAMFRKSGYGFKASWHCLFGHASNEEWPVPSSQCEIWRYTSMEQLVEQVGRSTITRGQEKETNLPAGSDHTEMLIRHVIQARRSVANTIGGQLTTVSTMTDLSRVPLIVDKAFSLAMDMSLQRSRLQVTWPFVGDQFAEGQMACVPDPDGEEFEQGTVAFTVNPGLAKWGDANGKNFEERHDIVPSLVHVERLDVKIECQEPVGMDF
jgi:hypothetical protein